MDLFTISFYKGDSSSISGKADAVCLAYLSYSTISTYVPTKPSLAYQDPKE